MIAGTRVTLEFLDFNLKSIYSNQLKKFVVMCWQIGNWKSSNWLIREAYYLPQVGSISNDRWDMRKLFGRWAPFFHTIYHILNCVSTSKGCLALFNCNLDQFYWRSKIVTGTKIHYVLTEFKLQSKEWVSWGVSTSDGLSWSNIIPTNLTYSTTTSGKN